MSESEKNAQASPSPMRDHLELLLHKVEDMLDAQRNYFKNKGSVRLGKCKAKEKDVSQLCNLLRLKGYNTERFKPKTKQEELFNGKNS